TCRDSSTTGTCATGCPATCTEPVSSAVTVCGTTPEIVCSTVVLPDPEAPSTSTCSPGAICRTTSRRIGSRRRGTCTVTSSRTTACRSPTFTHRQGAPDGEVVDDAGSRQGVDDHLGEQATEDDPGHQLHPQA